MKTKEELNALKKEDETLNKKLADLSEDELKQVSGGITDYDIEDRVRSSFNELKRAVGCLPDDPLIKPRIDTYMVKCEAAINARNWCDVRSCCGLISALAHVTAADTTEYKWIQFHTDEIITRLSYFE